MHADDIFNKKAFPNRPDHSDFWKLADKILWMDGRMVESQGADVPKILEEIGIDSESLEYVSFQRGLRALSPFIGKKAEDMTRKDVEENAALLSMFGAMFIEGFIVGRKTLEP